MHQSFVAFPIHHALRDEFKARLYWAHFRLLLGIADAAAHDWYMS